MKKNPGANRPSIHTSREELREKGPRAIQVFLYLIILVKLVSHRSNATSDARKLFSVVYASSAEPLSSTALSSIPTRKTNCQNGKTLYFSKFESCGPTVTIFVRDPLKALFLQDSGYCSKNDSTSNIFSRNRKRTDRGGNGPQSSHYSGLLSKLASWFYTARKPTSSLTSMPLSPPLSDTVNHYMLNNDKKSLPSCANHFKQSSPSETCPHIQLWSSFMDRWRRYSTLSEGVMDVHSEVRYELKSRSLSSVHGNDAVQNGADNEINSDNGGIDFRPFPSTLPWLSAISCGVILHPSLINNVRGTDAFARKLRSPPHIFMCGVKILLPRIFRHPCPWSKNDDGASSGHNAELHVEATLRTYPCYHVDDLDLLISKSGAVVTSPAAFVSKKLHKKLTEAINTQDMKRKTTKHSSGFNNTRKNNHFLIRLSTSLFKKKKPIPADAGSSTLSPIQHAKGSFTVPSPFLLRSLCPTEFSVSPSYDFVEGKAVCVLSGDVGSSGRTRAILRLDIDDSTLTLITANDNNNIIIAPTISLRSGRIVYDWHLALSKCIHSANENQRYARSSVTAHVDPKREVQIIWTDDAAGSIGKGCWVAECRVPLGAAHPGRNFPLNFRFGRRLVM